MKAILDDKEVKVGDRLYSVSHDWALVRRIETYDDTDDMSILAGDHWYYSDGRYTAEGGRVLFWDKVKITPPIPPKRMVKRWQWVVRNKLTGRFEITRNYYATADVAKGETGNMFDLFEPYLPSEIEVEE